MIESRPFVGDAKTQGAVRFPMDVHRHLTLGVTLVAVLDGVEQEFTQNESERDGLVHGESARKAGAGSYRLVDEVKFRPEAETNGILFDDGFKHGFYLRRRLHVPNCRLREVNFPCQ